MYSAPVDDIIAALEITGRDFEVEFDPSFARDVFTNAGTYCSNEILPQTRVLEQSRPRLVNGSVKSPEAVKTLYASWCENGWSRAGSSEQHGGLGLPHAWNLALFEIWNSGSMSFGIGPCLTVGATETIAKYGSRSLRQIYLPKLTSGEWMGTMCLTEPNSGSDLSQVRTRADRQPDGTFSIHGQKIFITYGDHDLTSNIVHLVLARTNDAPAGTQGLSLFLVPKFLPEADGDKPIENDVLCIGLEEKLGLHGSPTCTLQFGNGSEGARGWLIGKEFRGLSQLFTMMNSARQFVATQGIGVAERALQMATHYAEERRQGKALRSSNRGEEASVEIIHHPDIQLQLAVSRVEILLARLLVLAAGQAVKRAASESFKKDLDFAGLLTPIAKIFATEIGCAVADRAIQVFGGMGYIEETGVAQLFRDARIAPIYEGTNGIQAIDLIQRKIDTDRGAIDALIDRLEFRKAGSNEESGCLMQKSDGLLDYLRKSVAIVRKYKSMNEEAAQLAAATHFAKLCALCLGGAYLVRMALSNTAGSERYLLLCEVFFAEFAPQVPSLVSRMRRLPKALEAAYGPQFSEISSQNEDVG